MRFVRCDFPRIYTPDTERSSSAQFAGQAKLVPGDAAHSLDFETALPLSQLGLDGQIEQWYDGTTTS